MGRVAAQPNARMLTIAAALWAIAIAGYASVPSEADLPRSRVPLNSGWRFKRGDPPGTGDQLTYAQLKSAMLAPKEADVPAVEYARHEFDDGRWRLLDLPHDWGIEGPFDQGLPGETAKLPYAGVGWYRKHFAVPASDKGRQLYLDVDGAMSYANVWVNGHYVGGWPYGYASWRVDLTPYIQFGGKNIIAIRLDNPPKSSRWYPGGGIYRNVWLVKTSAAACRSMGYACFDAESKRRDSDREHRREGRQQFGGESDSQGLRVHLFGFQRRRASEATDRQDGASCGRSRSWFVRDGRPHRPNFQAGLMEPGATAPLHGRC